jgi:hypothetical protein
MLYDQGMAKRPSEPLFISVREAAEIAGFHCNTIKRWVTASERKAAAGLEPDFLVSKPAGVRNGRWRIHRESFLAFMKRTAHGDSRVVMAPRQGPNVVFAALAVMVHELFHAKPHGGPSIG